jgi:hypothetical protein
MIKAIKSIWTYRYVIIILLFLFAMLEYVQGNHMLDYNKTINTTSCLNETYCGVP